MKKYFMMMLVAAFGFASCEKEKNNELGGIFKGPETDVYHGKAWTWVQLDKKGIPERVAIAMNDKVLENVTPADETGGGTDHQHNDNILLKFHPKASITIFNHAWLNWNPNGHPPAGIYNKPHFDLHYYMTSSEERETYLDPAKLDASPAADYIPANHIGADPVPTMGKHFVDVTSPEFGGQPFTQTFIYGSYDSKVVFLEPMITLDFLKSTINFERPIPQPAKFHKSGYYPTRMRILKQNGVTNVILESFVYRTAS